MKIIDIVDVTSILVAGHIDSEMSYDKVKLVMENNSSLFNKFNNTVFVLNKNSDVSESEIEEVIECIKEYIDNPVIIFDHANRGHQIGHVDLDKLGFSYIKNNISNMKYMLKFSIDILVKENFLEINIDEDTDFLYQPSINLVDYDKYGESYYNLFRDEYKKTNPQTIYYILSTKADFPYEDGKTIDNNYDDWIDKGYKKVSQNLVLASEHSLNKSVIRNNFKKQMMVNRDEFNKILNFMVNYFKVTGNSDCTLKNIYIPELGICHWQFKHEVVINCE
tara:strand:- start:394 stop:1227 length:834 start_codon:yes stop_codon:yes gene_type:complete